MSDLRIAAQQALEALETLVPTKGPSIYNSARDALRSALAQQDEPVLVQGELPPRYVARSPIQAEPVEQLAELQAMLRAEVDRLIAAGIQPQRKLVPLTEEEIMHIGMTHQSLRQVVRAVERAHGIGEIQ